MVTGFNPFTLSCIESLWANVVFPEEDGPDISTTRFLPLFDIVSAILASFFSCSASDILIISVDFPAFYSYAYPAPPGFDGARVKPNGTFFNKELGEFVLPYDIVRQAKGPDATLLDFLQSTYEAAADTGRWDRAALECPLGHIGVPHPVQDRRERA
jgi:hypothetical protein